MSEICSVISHCSSYTFKNTVTNFTKLHCELLWTQLRSIIIFFCEIKFPSFTESTNVSTNINTKVNNKVLESLMRFISCTVRYKNGKKYIYRLYASLWISVLIYQINFTIVWCNYSFLHFNINNISCEIQYNMGLWTMWYEQLFKTVRKLHFIFNLMWTLP